MATEKLTVKAKNARFLKGHASWLYCGKCNKTVAYLCYVTYRFFRFSFDCACGGEGFVENSFGEVDTQTLPVGSLVRNAANNRYCCANDDSPLFSPVPKNLRSYSAEIVCKTCDTCYTVQEKY